MIVNELRFQKFFIDNQLVMPANLYPFHNSLIVNKLFFQIIWPVREKVVSLLRKE